VRTRADERQALEQLCRYVTRPAQANERVQCNGARQVMKLTTPWRDGATCQVMSPPELMQRPAALVPRPRVHLRSSQDVSRERLLRDDHFKAVNVADGSAALIDDGLLPESETSTAAFRQRTRQGVRQVSTLSQHLALQ
jgi:hypothetical protein